jgi:flagellar basal body-associated protein FliL
MSNPTGGPEAATPAVVPQPQFEAPARSPAPTGSPAAGAYASHEYALLAPTNTARLGPAPSHHPPDTSGDPGRAGKRRPRVIVLVCLLVVFVVATAVMTALFVAKSGDYTRARRTVAARSSNLQAERAHNQQLSSDLQSTRDELDKVKQDLEGIQKQADELRHEKQVITDCVNLLAQASDAQHSGDPAGAQAKLRQARAVCVEAQRYLGD